MQGNDELLPHYARCANYGSSQHFLLSSGHFSILSVYAEDCYLLYIKQSRGARVKYIVSSFANWGVQRGTSSEGLGDLGYPQFQKSPNLGGLRGLKVSNLSEVCSKSII